MWNTFRLMVLKSKNQPCDVKRIRPNICPIVMKLNSILRVV